jgi:ribosomal RNA-processing protein 7
LYTKQIASKKRELDFENVDEDGFMLVKHRKKKRRTETPKRGKMEKRARLKKKGGELKNFYRYQMREEKREKLADLRKKFEEDKIKIASMKLARKFKPF